MLSISLLVRRLETDFPIYLFKPSDEFRWSPGESTVYYSPTSHDNALLLHELSHAILAHKEYTRDIGLLELEREAWEYARHMLAANYSVTIPEDIIQDSLDTYRDWLHGRSTCPHCNATGIQVRSNRYRCISCGTLWRVNDGRTCALRRYLET